MKHRHTWISVIALFLTSFAWAQSDSSFTYQGALQDSGSPANGSFDLTFTLWGSAAGGTQFGSAVVENNLAVVDGLFDIELDFGAQALGVGGRWLEITVDGTTLSPRTQITSSPYSVQTRGIFVNDQNRVGMGTQLPSSLLHLKNQTPFSNIPDRMLTLDSHDDPNNFDLQSGSGSGILFKVPYQSDSRNGAAIDAVRTTNAELDSSTALVFSTSGNTNILSEAMRIDAAGTVRLQDKLVFGNATSLFGQLTIPDLGSAFAIDVASSNLVLPTIFASNTGSGPVLWASGANDVSLSGGGLIMIGSETEANLTMDRNEIMARNNGAPAGLFLNFEGGEVAMGKHRIHPAYAYGKLNSSGTLANGSSNIIGTSRNHEGQYEVVIEGGILNTDIFIVSTDSLFFLASGVRDNTTGHLIINVYFLLDEDFRDRVTQFVIYRP
tara:strand:- start:500372 stop:501685 length:1314 start_codon:yes stop_codon:yes gene_type:complete